MNLAIELNCSSRSGISRRSDLKLVLRRLQGTAAEVNESREHSEFNIPETRHGKWHARLGGMLNSNWTRLDTGIVTEGDEMNSDYVFLCGVMWCGYGQQEAGRELLRAALSRDPDISTLAWAMFAKGKTALREKLVGEHRSIKS